MCATSSSSSRVERGAKASFATKAVNPDLLRYDPRGGTRVRFSLMPREVSRLVDVRTHPVAQRIAAIDDFVAAGYEVHVNLSPVIVADGWLDGWDELLGELDAGTGPAEGPDGRRGDLPHHNDRLMRST
jgi:DNA repair photolyase